MTREVLPSIRRTGTYVSPKAQAYQGVNPVPGQRYYDAMFGTMAASTSPGPVIGSLPAGRATVSLADFLEFSKLCFDVPDGTGTRMDFPSEDGVLRYLAARGFGDQCCRNPLNGKWMFCLDALQDWYRHVGSVRVSPPV